MISQFLDSFIPRNCLNTKHSAKLQFIYINCRTLRYKYTSKKRQPQTWLQLTEDEGVEMEDANFYH